MQELCDLVGVVPDGGAVVEARKDGRRTIAFTEEGRVTVVAKVGRPGDVGRTREIEFLQRLQGQLSGVLVPTIRWTGLWCKRPVLAMNAVTSGRSARDVGLEDALKVSLVLARGANSVGPVVHGDLAPWNLMDTPRGIALVDWETSRQEIDPLFDLAHYVDIERVAAPPVRSLHRGQAAHRARLGGLALPGGARHEPRRRPRARAQLSASERPITIAVRPPVP